MNDNRSPIYSDEIFDLINRAILKQLPPERFTIIFDDKTVIAIFDICQSAIKCDYKTFREGIETANFEEWEIKRQNFIQDLTYRLSEPMGAEWYNRICWRMYWKKKTVSGQGQKLENDLLIKKLNKILPRPKKMIAMQ